MKRSCLRYFFSGIFIINFYQLPAQVFSNEMSSLDKVNVYKVVTFDEFVNRFNNDPKSNIRKAYKYYHAEFRIKRPALVRSLFDYETKSWDSIEIKRFIAEVADPSKSRLLNTSGGLLAEARCRFRYNAADVELSLMLRYLFDPAKGSKWVICGVGAYALALNNLQAPEIKENSIPKFINPVNNDINFSELQRVFEDKGNMQQYFEKDFFQKKRSLGFYNAVLQDQIRFLGVKDIQYHILQYDAWVFTVKEFRRNTLNSGWLINRLIAVTAPEKEKYLRSLMGE